MVSRRGPLRRHGPPRKITRVPRFIRLVPAVLLSVALTACGGGVHGTPGGLGLHDPYFPRAGNGGYDVTHYDLTLAYDPAHRRLTGTAVITVRATEDLSAFDLDGPQGAGRRRRRRRGPGRPLEPRRPGAEVCQA